MQGENRGIVEPLGHKVSAIVNYDGFELDRDVEDAYLDALKEIGDRYFYGVTRFATSAFMRSKLGDALEKRGVAAHVFESEEEARRVVRQTNSRGLYAKRIPPHHETGCNARGTFRRGHFKLDDGKELLLALVSIFRPLDA